MNFDRATELLKASFIPPQVLIDHVGVDFMQMELDFLQDIPDIAEKILLSRDPYQPHLKVKDTFILFPIGTRTRTTDLDFVYFLNRFGTNNEARNPFCFFQHLFRVSAEATFKPKPVFWKKGLGPVGWCLIRKQPPIFTIGKDYDECGEILKENNHDFPTMMELILAMAVYYFSTVNPQLPDKFVGQNFWESRDTIARILYAGFSWVGDDFNDKEKLVIGLNDAEGGVYIYPHDKTKSSRLIGALPIIRLEKSP